ncbi:MAG: hypothetical protein ACNI25_02090 [Halarcobacter sp.]
MESQVVNETFTSCPVIWKKEYEGKIAVVHWSGLGSLEKCGDKFYMQVDVLVFGTHHRFKLPVIGNEEKYITIDGIRGWYKISGFSLTDQSIRFHIEIQVQFVFWYKVVSDWVVASFPKLNSYKLSSIILEQAKDIDNLTGLENLSNENWTKQDPQ